MKYLLTTILIFITAFSFSQNKRDTIYMNEDWDVTKIIDSAKYYRIIKEADGLYYVTDYYIESDSVQMTGAYKDYAQKIREGEFVYYSKKGLVTKRTNYKNGLLHGSLSSYYDTGELHYTDHFVNDSSHGDFIVYYRNGSIRRKETWVHDKLKFKACYLENGKKTKYFPYSVPANPKGGMESVKKFLVKNLHYPDSAVDAEIEGKVYIRFVVSTTGKITNIRIKQSAGYAILDKEAIRIVGLLPDWSPAQLDGEKVESTFNLPISFKLN